MTDLNKISERGLNRKRERGEFLQVSNTMGIQFLFLFLGVKLYKVIYKYILYLYISVGFLSYVVKI